MEKKQLKEGIAPFAPRTVDAALYPDIDGSYSARTYRGERIRINTRQLPMGAKQFYSLVANMQGISIYGDILVQMANVGTSTTHYVYRVTASGNVLLGQFTLTGTGHSNALQFGNVVPSGHSLPYLYVVGLSGYCYVVQVADTFDSASIVQTISINLGGQVMRGQDGFVWSITNENDHRCFKKYRAVEVSEGATVTLTDGDKLDEWTTEEEFPSASYTFQGWKEKDGKLWLLYGATGDGQKRGIVVYDTPTHRLCSFIDLTSLADVEPEDLDFWDDAILFTCYDGKTYILRF